MQNGLAAQQVFWVYMEETKSANSPPTLLGGLGLEGAPDKQDFH